MAKDAYAVVVGGLNMDIQGKSFGAFRPGDSNPGGASLSPGGVGRNIAENLVRLGLRTELVSALGDDALSKELERSCLARGIGLGSSPRLRGRGASQYLCLLDAAGVLVGAVAAMDTLEALGPELLSERAGLMDGAAVLVADANLPRPSLEWLAGRYGRGGSLEAEKKRRPLFLLDPVSQAKAERARGLLGAFDLVKPNRAEARILAEFPEGAGALSAPELATALRGAGAGELYLSLGAEGLYFEGAEARGYARPPRLPVLNVSGAGDAAAAALVWAALEGYTCEDRARFAVAAAALAAGSEATVSPDMSARRLMELAQGVELERLS